MINYVFVFLLIKYIYYDKHNVYSKSPLYCPLELNWGNLKQEVGDMARHGHYKMPLICPPPPPPTKRFDNNNVISCQTFKNVISCQCVFQHHPVCGCPIKTSSLFKSCTHYLHYMLYIVIVSAMPILYYK